MRHRFNQCPVLALACLFASATLFAAPAPRAVEDEVLSPLQQRESEQSVDRALRWLATQQSQDGSFNTSQLGRPAVTSLCVLAFLSRGHLPGQGPYGERIDRAIEFVLGCQKPDGSITYGEVDLNNLSRPIGQADTYNHAISALALS